MNHETARALIIPFYDALTRPATKNVGAIIREITAPDWTSWGGDDKQKSRDAFIAQVEGFGKLMPDLTWTIREVLVNGQRIVVRSTATGTPVGPLFGVPPSGRSFAVMTIDIHTVVDGKLAVAHHVEDWAGAIEQLSAK